MTGNCRSFGCMCVVFVTFTIRVVVGIRWLFVLILIFVMTGNCQSGCMVRVVVGICWLFVLTLIFVMTGNCWSGCVGPVLNSRRNLLAVCVNFNFRYDRELSIWLCWPCSRRNFLAVCVHFNFHDDRELSIWLCGCLLRDFCCTCSRSCQNLF